jgi:hypothetical protein
MQKESILSSSKRDAKRDDSKFQNRCTMQAAKQILVTNLNMTSLKVIQLFQS